MALASRLVSRSRQLYTAQPALVNGCVNQVRSYAKEAAPADRPPVTGDGLLKGIFFDVKKKFEIALSVFKTERVIIDPDDPAAVNQFAKVKKIIREKANLPTEGERIQNTIETFTKGIPDARTYFNKLSELRIKSGIIDVLGIEPLMMEAVDKVEKEIKKPLLRSDKKNMAILMAEFDKINRSFGFSKEDLPKIEEEMELDISKAQLAQLKNKVTEDMENLLKREEFKGEKMPDLRTIDVRDVV